MATIRPVSIPTKRLASAITSSATSFQLTDILGWDSAALTSGSFGTKAYGVFRDATNAHIELFEFDPTTIASTSITINLRGLKFDGDLTTEVAGNKRSWTKGTLVELGTHVPQLFRHYVDTLEAQTIAGIKTFSALPATTAGNPTADNDLVRKAYADSILSGGSGIPNRVVVAGNGGESISAGDLVYLLFSDGEWYKCDADTAGSVDNVVLGIAQGTGTDGGAISGGVLIYGLDSNQSGLTNNTIYYASNNAGLLSASAGTTEVTIGVARSTTTILFNPRYNQVLTERQQDLLDVAVNSTEWYAASVVGTDSYAITVSPAITAYATGQKFRFKADVANTGAATLAVSGLAAKTIKRVGSTTDLSTGDIAANQMVEVMYDGTNFQLTSATGGLPDVQVFTSNGTWTKPAGAKVVDVYCVGSGGGGGSGARGTSPATGGGGGGGSGGSIGYKRFAADALSSTETVTVGVGGAGGAGQTTPDTDGVTGSTGNPSIFGTTALLRAPGGLGGVGGGRGTGGAGGAAPSAGNGDWSAAGGAGGAGGNGDSTGGTQGTDTATALSPRGGGGGGGAGNFVGYAGGNGGAFITNYVKAGGAGGTAGGSGDAGDAGSSTSSSLLYGGVGGGGGGSGAPGSPVGGGAGGSPGGGGGGTTGANATNTIIGGAGGDGMVVVISYT